MLPAPPIPVPKGNLESVYISNYILFSLNHHEVSAQLLWFGCDVTALFPPPQALILEVCPQLVVLFGDVIEMPGELE